MKPWSAVGLYIILLLPFLKLQHFGDEYEHAMAGWFLLHHLLPYTNYFSHHAPLTLFLGLLGYVIPSDPILVLRVWALAFQAAVWWFLFKVTNQKLWPVLMLTMAVTALAVPTFLLQLALANVLVNFGLLVMLVLLLQRYLFRAPNPRYLLTVFALANLVCIWSSVAAVTALVALDGLLLALLWSQKALPSLKQIGQISFWAVAAGLIFPGFYFLTGAFKVFFWSVFTYNTQYYFPLRLADGPAEHRWGPFYRMGHQFSLFLWLEVGNFLTASLTWLRALVGSRALLTDGAQIPSYLGLVTQVYGHEILVARTALAVALVGLWVALLAVKRWRLMLVTLLLAFSFYFRDNELFHLAPLLLGVSLGLAWLLVESWRDKRWLVLGWTAGLVAYLCLALAVNWRQTLIDQSPYVSLTNQEEIALIKSWTKPEGTLMVLDSNMVYYPLAQRLPGCHYHYYLPWLHQTPVIRAAMESCLKNQTSDFVLIPDASRPEVRELWPIIQAAYQPVASGSSLYRKITR